MEKVLYIVDSLKQRAGITSVVMNYFMNMNREKIQIDFLVLGDREKEIVNQICERGSSVYFMPRPSGGGFKFIKLINKFFEEHNEYHVVHSHFNQIDGVVFPIAKKYGVKITISHSHNTRLSDFKMRAIRNRILCLTIPYSADVWAACSEVAGRALYGKRFSNSKKRLLIKNAINTEDFSFRGLDRRRLRKELGLTEYIVLGFVGGFRLQKNIAFLLEVFAELVTRSREQKYHLMLVGSGELEEELKHKTEELGICQNVLFTGQRSDVSYLMQAMDIFILPSLYEGLPVVGIEAQALGLPCILSDSITKEVNMGLCIYLSLRQGKIYWASQIANVIPQSEDERTHAADILKEHGYDIRNECEKLTELYSTM